MADWIAGGLAGLAVMLGTWALCSALDRGPRLGVLLVLAAAGLSMGHASWAAGPDVQSGVGGTGVGVEIDARSAR